MEKDPSYISICDFGQELAKELNNFLFLFEVFGMQFFSLKHLTKKNYKDKLPFARKIQMILLSLFIISLVACFSIFNMEENINIKATPKNVLTKAIQTYMRFCLVIVIIMSAIQSCASTQNIKLFYINMQEIAQLGFSNFNLRFNFKAFIKAAWIKFAIMLMFYATMHTIVIALNTREFNAIGAILSIFFVIVFKMIIFKFVFYVCLVNYQLEFLKLLLDSTFIYQPVKIIDNINYHLLHVKPLKPAESSLRKILKSRMIFNKIYHNGKLVNESIGLTMLSLLISSVVTLTSSGYEVLKISLGGMPADRLPGT